jgi:hypothetical protein
MSWNSRIRCDDEFEVRRVKGVTMGDSPYKRFLDARDRERDAERDGSSTAEIYSELRKALCDELLAYCRDISDTSCRDKSETIFNSEMAHYLHTALRFLVENHDHPLFQIAGRGRGNPGLTPDERSCVADAVRYIRAARTGVIDDPNSVETVLKAYTEKAADANMDQRTVERWQNRDDMKGVRVADVDSDLIPMMMRYSAGFYGRNFAR